MSDREYFQRRAEAERVAARVATDSAAFRKHMQQAREYEWRAVTEPYPDQQYAGSGERPRGAQQPRHQ